MPFPSPGDPPKPEIDPKFLVSPALASRFFTTVPPGKPGGWLRPPKWSQAWAAHPVHTLPHHLTQVSPTSGSNVL